MTYESLSLSDRQTNARGSAFRNKTYKLILIGGDSGEYGLREYEGLVWLSFQVFYRIAVAGVRSLHQMNPWLILVHRI